MHIVHYSSKVSKELKTGRMKLPRWTNRGWNEVCKSSVSAELPLCPPLHPRLQWEDDPQCVARSQFNLNFSPAQLQETKIHVFFNDLNPHSRKIACDDDKKKQMLLRLASTSGAHTWRNWFNRWLGWNELKCIRLELSLELRPCLSTLLVCSTIIRLHSRLNWSKGLRQNIVLFIN